MEWIVIIGLIIYLIFERDRTNRLERELKELKQRIAPLHRPDPAPMSKASHKTNGAAPPEIHRCFPIRFRFPGKRSLRRNLRLSVRAKNRNRRFLVPFRPEEKRPPSLPPAAPVPNGNS